MARPTTCRSNFNALNTKLEHRGRSAILTLAYTLLAMSLSELGQYEEALPALVKGFGSRDQVVGRMAGLHLQRAYTGLARDLEAVEIALALSRLYPDDPEVLYHSGRLCANFAYVQTMRLAKVAPNSVWLHQRESQPGLPTAGRSST